MSGCIKRNFNITHGNSVFLHLILTRYAQIFPTELSESVEVNLVSRFGVRFPVSNVTVNDNGSIDAIIDEVRSVGEYGVEVRGTLNEYKWRTYTGNCINFTYETEIGDSEGSVIGDTFDISMEVQMNAPHESQEAISAQIASQYIDGHNNNGESHQDIRAMFENYISKEEGKDLSENNFSDEYREALDLMIESLDGGFYE